MSVSLLAPVLSEYLKTHNRPEHPVLRRCREETQRLPAAGMQISPEQGAFHHFLLELIGAKRTFEVGVFTGYSALITALAIQPRGGTLLGCDTSEEWTSRARSYFSAAHVEDVVELVLAPAHETLRRRLAQGEGGTYDFGFIDADKESSDQYYELALDLLRTGGLLVCDNMLWSGRVADPADTSHGTQELRALALKARDDARVEATLIAVGDGLLLCRKK